jgi:hypothetical protein
MSWTERITDATGSRPQPRDIDLAPVEAELGTALPGDYRELCSLFGRGLYSGFVQIMQPGGAGDVDSINSWWRSGRRAVETLPGGAGLYQPYELYADPGRPGLLCWGGDQTEGEYYWLADAGADPNTWPVCARNDADDPWHRYEMTRSESHFRMLTDPDFTPFSVAGTTARPFILPEGVQITTVEEWNAWANRGGDPPAR